MNAKTAGLFQLEKKGNQYFHLWGYTFHAPSPGIDNPEYINQERYSDENECGTRYYISVDKQQESSQIHHRQMDQIYLKIQIPVWQMLQVQVHMLTVSVYQSTVDKFKFFDHNL